jgi:hypothetical protein
MEQTGARGGWATCALAEAAFVSQLHRGNDVFYLASAEKAGP